MRKYLIYGCVAVIIVSIVALLIVTSNKQQLNTIASPNDTSLDMTTVKIKNIDLYDTDKSLNGATFRITDQTKDDSFDTQDVTIVDDGELYVDLPYGTYTLELISPAPDYAPGADIKSFTLSDISIEPFNIVVKSELKKPLDTVPTSKTSDLLPVTSSNTNSIFTSDSPSKNPKTNDNFFKYSFFILIACGINFALINTFIYIKKSS